MVISWGLSVMSWDADEAKSYKMKVGDIAKRRSGKKEKAFSKKEEMNKLDKGYSSHEEISILACWELTITFLLWGRSLFTTVKNYPFNLKPIYPSTILSDNM